MKYKQNTSFFAFVQGTSLSFSAAKSNPLSSTSFTPSLQLCVAKSRSSKIVEECRLPFQAKLADSIQRALENEFRGKDIHRVTASFQNALSGNALEVDKGLPTHQRAASFIEGLDARPYYDEFSNDFQWINYLENNWQIIADELQLVTSQKDIEKKGNNIWAPPVVEAANAYGPDWRTLVLQDRSWDPKNTKLFPETTRILQDKTAKVPCVEAFFARQTANTGIKLHTDDCNFILTVHLGLSTPHKKSWIEVAGERRYWENGKALVFNTSFFHRTMNESEDEDRQVLLLRCWHPQVTQIERNALSFLFKAIENPETNAAVLQAEKDLRRESQNMSNAKNVRKKRKSGRGFAK